MIGESVRRRIHAWLTMLVLAGITLVLVSAADAGAMSQPAKQSRSSEANTLRAIERKRLHALVDADTATARKFIAHDFQLINPGGGESSRHEYLESVAAGEPDYLAFEPTSPIAVRLHGNTAALRFMVHFDLVVAGTRLTHEAWITELWERRAGRWQTHRAGRWQIVWEQATAIPNDFGLFVQSLLPPEPPS